MGMGELWRWMDIGWDGTTSEIPLSLTIFVDLFVHERRFENILFWFSYYMGIITCNECSRFKHIIEQTIRPTHPHHLTSP